MTLFESILQQYGTNEPILSSEVSFQGYSRPWIYKQLNQLCEDGKLVRYDSIRMPQLLDAILSVFPLDYFVDKSVTLMAVEPGDDAKTPIWDEYKAIIAKYDSRGTDTIEYVSRLDYYDRAKKCFAVVATGESAAYGNIILKKGPLFE